MKRIIIVLLALMSVAQAQNINTVTQGSKNTLTDNLGWVKGDSGLIAGRLSSLTNTRFKDSIGTIVMYNDSLWYRSSVGWLNTSRSSGGNTIYTGNGTLSGNRHINANSNGLYVDSLWYAEFDLIHPSAFKIKDHELGVIFSAAGGSSFSQVRFDNVYSTNGYARFLMDATDNIFEITDKDENGIVSYPASLSTGYTDTFATQRYARSVAGGGSGFWTDNGNDIYNNNSGNIGIHNSTPNAMLTVGEGGGTLGTYFQTFGSNGNDFVLYSYPLDSYIFRVDGDNQYTLFNEGNANWKTIIGSSNGTYPLTIKQSGVNSGYGIIQQSIEGVDSEEGIMFNNTGTGGRSYSIFSTNNSSGVGGGNFMINDVTAAATRFTIDATGNVGIGTTTPQGSIDVVNGNRRLIMDDANNQFKVYGSSQDDQMFFDFTSHQLFFYCGDQSSFHQTATSFEFQGAQSFTTYVNGGDILLQNTNANNNLTLYNNGQVNLLAAGGGNLFLVNDANSNSIILDANGAINMNSNGTESIELNGLKVDQNQKILSTGDLSLMGGNAGIFNDGRVYGYDVTNGVNTLYTDGIGDFTIRDKVGSVTTLSTNGFGDLQLTDRNTGIQTFYVDIAGMQTIDAASGIGLSPNWLLGANITGVTGLVLDTTQYVVVSINGVQVKLAVVN